MKHPSPQAPFPTHLKPLYWGLFAAGGMVAALFFPALVLVTALLVPAGVVDGPSQGLVTHWLFRLALLVLVPLPLFHAAHRMMAAFMDFGLRPWLPLVSGLLYGGAFLGFALALWTVVTM
jgi:fumarate reductase subunit D